MKIALIVIGIVFAIVAIGFIYYGGLAKVTCRIEKQGGEILIYRQMTGDYARSAIVMDEIYYSLLKEYGIETFKGFGIYYDNPKEVEKSKLRSDIGCVLEEKDSSKLSLIKDLASIKVFPEETYIVTEFPSKGKLSVLLGIIKVYPAIEKFAEKHGYPKSGAVMEIYDVPSKKIFYRKAIGD